MKAGEREGERDSDCMCAVSGPQQGYKDHYLRVARKWGGGRRNRAMICECFLFPPLIRLLHRWLASVGSRWLLHVQRSQR